LAVSWNLPQNGFFPVLIATTPYTYNCTSCSDQGAPNSGIVVRQHDLLGPVAITDWPGFNFIPGDGLTALICATVATEETTWGKVKALYQE
jgi:hypothetical protein